MVIWLTRELFISDFKTPNGSVLKRRTGNVGFKQHQSPKFILYCYMFGNAPVFKSWVCCYHNSDFFFVDISIIELGLIWKMFDVMNREPYANIMLTLKNVGYNWGNKIATGSFYLIWHTTVFRHKWYRRISLLVPIFPLPPIINTHSWCFHIARLIRF